MDNVVELEVRGSVENVDLDVESEENVDLEVGSEGGEEQAVNSYCASYNPQVPHDLKPRKGQEFETLEDVKNFYNAYAREAGFSIRSWSAKKRRVSDEVVRKEYVCYKQGKSSGIVDVEKKRRRGTSKEGCNAKLAVVKSKTGSFVVTVFVEGHSHTLLTPQNTHLLRSHRNVSTVQKRIDEIAMGSIPPHQQSSFLRVQDKGIQNIEYAENDLRNNKRDKHNEMKGHDGDRLHDYFKLEQGKNPSFTFKIEVNDQNRISRCFWANATSRRAYSFYNDVVIFDTIYNTSRCDLIFAALMGVNNHGQTIIFACAFLSDESVDSFVWLFNQFLEAILGDAPKMIITDQDPVITKAISQTLPSSFHRYCSCHILMKFSEKIDTIKYSQYYDEFSNCIWQSESNEEFDLKWMELVEKSGLNGNQWLKSLYEIRSRWVPAYVNRIFSAKMSSSQGAESVHSFIKKFAFKYNSLVDFMIQFDRRLARQRHEELMADRMDMTEKRNVKMPHDFLIQAVDIYTLKMFLKFQDELWDSLNYKFKLIKDIDNYRVYQIQRKNVEKCKVREIFYDKDLDFASCSCKMFESSGIPCKHILAYLNKMHDFDKLPNQYILKRWTQYAKSGLVLDDGGMQMIVEKSYLLKRSRLIQFSIDVVDMALASEETIKVYTDGLGKALEEINQLVDCGTSAGVSSEKSNQIAVCATSKRVINNS